MHIKGTSEGLSSEYGVHGVFVSCATFCAGITLMYNTFQLMSDMLVFRVRTGLHVQLFVSF